MRTSVNVPAGIVIDLVYGFAMAGLFILLYNSLPGRTGIVKGMSLALIMWFFRVVMYAGSQWMMFRVPGGAVVYMLVTGLVEMVVLGLVYGLTLKWKPKDGITPDALTLR
jgi:hypothetical protein